MLASIDKHLHKYTRSECLFFFLYRADKCLQGSTILFFKKFEKCNMIIFLAPLPICSPSKVTFKGAEFTMLEASAALD